MKRFLWGGSEEVRKIHWVAWEVVTLPVDQGGLGIEKIKSMNQALLSKWTWRFKSEKTSLWKEVIMAIHGSGNRWECVPMNRSISGVWKSLVSVVLKLSKGGVALTSFLKCNIGTGDSIRFWLDDWSEKGRLKDLFPNLFKLERNKRCFVMERFRMVNNVIVCSWDWIKNLVKDSELEEWRVCFRIMVEVLGRRGRVDLWRWDLPSCKGFSAGAVRKWISNGEGIVGRSRVDWPHVEPHPYGRGFKG